RRPTTRPATGSSRPPRPRRWRRRSRAPPMTDLPLMKDGLARPSAGDLRGWLLRGEVLMALGVIGIIMLLIVPVPSILLDLLLAMSVVCSLLVRLTAL